MMRYCIKLILSGQSPFEFVRSLKNQVENIRQTGGFYYAVVYQALVEQLGTYSNDLRNLERANPTADAQRASEELHINQEEEQMEIEEQIAECIRHIDIFRISYQGLTDDIHQSEVISKAMEDVIASARVAIAKAQALIQDHELKLANEKKRVEELESIRHRAQKELEDHSSKLETLRAQLASKTLLSDEELRAQALAKIEVACQRDMQRLKNKYNLLLSKSDSLYSFCNTLSFRIRECLYHF